MRIGRLQRQKLIPSLVDAVLVIARNLMPMLIDAIIIIPAWNLISVLVDTLIIFVVLLRVVLLVWQVDPHCLHPAEYGASTFTSCSFMRKLDTSAQSGDVYERAHIRWRATDACMGQNGPPKWYRICTRGKHKQFGPLTDGVVHALRNHQL